MRALLAVDERVPVAGITKLRRSLCDSGLSVATFGGRRTDSLAVLQGDTLQLVGGDDSNPVYSLHGSTIDCVHVALGSGMVEEVEVVITGFDQWLPSGQRPDNDAAFAAAREAVLMGRPAISLSLEDDIDPDDSQLGSDVGFKWCGAVVSELACWMVASEIPERSLLKIVIPRKITSFGFRMGDYAEVGSCLDGQITVIPVTLGAKPEQASARLKIWSHEAAAVINPRLGVTGGKCIAGCCN